MPEVLTISALSLWRRLRIYQAQRFPLLKVALLLGVLASAGINLSAHFAQRALPSWPVYAVALFVSIVFFF